MMETMCSKCPASSTASICLWPARFALRSLLLVQVVCTIAWCNLVVLLTCFYHPILLSISLLSSSHPTLLPHSLLSHPHFSLSHSYNHLTLPLCSSPPSPPLSSPLLPSPPLSSLPTPGNPNTDMLLFLFHVDGEERPTQLITHTQYQYGEVRHPCPIRGTLPHPSPPLLFCATTSLF